MLKVVAATETLAAGINMPARTTIISSLSHRQATGHALLKHNQLLQMAGRAGRRGFDVAGAKLESFVVSVWHARLAIFLFAEAVAN